MKLALETANEMERLSIIGKYTIAGSVAAIYYAEPIDTEDLDIFFLHESGSSDIFSMERMYEYFKEKGFPITDYTVAIGGVKVQFIPSTGPLSDEAIRNAKQVVLFGVQTYIVSQEYLIALKLAAGRGKDFTHILHLLSTTATEVHFDALDRIVSRFGLTEKWNRFMELTRWTKEE